MSVDVVAYSARPIVESFCDDLGRFCYRFTLPGAPRTKKTSNRVLKMGTRNVVMPSKAWITWRNDLRRYAATKPALTLAIARPTNCAVVFYRDAERGDMAGYIAGVADVLEELGIVVNDKHLTQFDGCRLAKDPENPRVLVTLTVLSDQEEIGL